MSLGVFDGLAHVLKVACGQAYHAFAAGGYVDAVEVRLRVAADQAAAREFLARTAVFG